MFSYQPENDHFPWMELGISYKLRIEDVKAYQENSFDASPHALLHVAANHIINNISLNSKREGTLLSI